MCAELNKWTDDAELALQLFPLLANEVFDFAMSLSAAKRTSYALLKGEIIKEYDGSYLESKYADELAARMLRRDADLTALMIDLKRLAEKAYPKFSGEDRETLVMNQFIRSLPAATRKQVLLQPKLENCSGLLETAKKIMEVEKGTSSSTVAAVVNPMDEMKAAIELLTEKVQSLSQGASVARVSQSQETQRFRGPFRGECYKCHEKGHMARDCRKQSSVCGTCGNPGHTENNCAMKKRGQEVCTKCGNPGHKEENCALNWRKSGFQ